MGSLALRLVAVAACMALAAAKGKSAARKEEELPDSLEGTADPAEYDPKVRRLAPPAAAFAATSGVHNKVFLVGATVAQKLVQGGMDIGPEMDTFVRRPRRAPWLR